MLIAEVTVLTNSQPPKIISVVLTTKFFVNWVNVASCVHTDSTGWSLSSSLAGRRVTITKKFHLTIVAKPRVKFFIQEDIARLKVKINVAEKTKNTNGILKLYIQSRNYSI